MLKWLNTKSRRSPTLAKARAEARGKGRGQGDILKECTRGIATAGLLMLAVSPSLHAGLAVMLCDRRL